jgi:hypothetical protein
MSIHNTVKTQGQAFEFLMRPDIRSLSLFVLIEQFFLQKLGQILVLRPHFDVTIVRYVPSMLGLSNLCIYKKGF